MIVYVIDAEGCNDGIIPQQHYLLKTKHNKIIKSFEEYESYGDSIFSLGHHRLFYLYNIGIRKLKL